MTVLNRVMCFYPSSQDFNEITWCYLLFLFIATFITIFSSTQALKQTSPHLSVLKRFCFLIFHTVRLYFFPSTVMFFVPSVCVLINVLSQVELLMCVFISWMCSFIGELDSVDVSLLFTQLNAAWLCVSVSGVPVFCVCVCVYERGRERERLTGYKQASFHCISFWSRTNKRRVFFTA